MKPVLISCLLLASLAGLAGGQRTPTATPAVDNSAPTAAAPADPETKPLPDIPALMRRVEVNQRTSESLQKDYIFRQSAEVEDRGGNDAVKKTERREADIFWIDGVRVGREISVDGKPLTPEQQKKESERIDKVVEKSRDRRDKADAKGQETDSHGREEITLSRVLELGSFSNPRRELIHARPTIVVDYTGDPHAKTRNTAEGIFRELAGTVWIDEQDAVIQHIEGRFANDFKIAGGLVASVRKGTWFNATAVKINGEVWLPSRVEYDGHARYLLFFSINGHGVITSTDYRKFRASSTILPGLTKVDPDAPAPTPAPTAPPKP